MKNNYEVSGICKTEKTKNSIEMEYWVEVYTDYSIINDWIFDLIVVSVPLENQWKILQKLAKKYKKTKFFVEIPVTPDTEILKKLTKMENVSYFLEESWTLLSKVLSKVKNPKIEIEVTINKVDLSDYNAMLVCYTHLLNNFLETEFLPDLNKIKFNFHDREDIFYKVMFSSSSSYIFDEKPRLVKWEKIYYDDYNFDINLKKLLDLDQKVLKEKFLKNSEIITDFLSNQSDF